MFRRILNLTDKGSKNLTVAVIACVFTNIATFLPFGILLQIINTLLKPLMEGGALNSANCGCWAGIGLLAAKLSQNAL